MERRRPVDPVRLADLFRDLDEALGADFLLDELHREERRQGLGADRLVGARVERWGQRHGKVGRDVVVVRR